MSPGNIHSWFSDRHWQLYVLFKGAHWQQFLYKRTRKDSKLSSFNFLKKKFKAKP